MLVTCLIQVCVVAGGINWIAEMAVTGVVIGRGPEKLAVDFSKDLRTKENLCGKATDYTKVLVDRGQCVKGQQ